MIRNTKELGEVAARLKAEGLVSLDTEFIWRNTYRPLLCVVQLGARDGTSWVVDCLTGLNTDPLADLLADPSVVKVLHAAQQDLEHLSHWTGASPVNIFDTQIAAAFAGFPSMMSLQKLLFEAIDVGLAKTETVTDWSQRPLTAAQEAYALDDVRYLGRLREDLLKRVESFGTRAWLEEDLAVSDDPSAFAPVDPEEVWKRIKCGRAPMDGRAFSVLRALAAERERLAREWNLPRAWLSDDASLVELARHQPATHPFFRHRLRNRGQQELLAAAFLKAIKAGLEVPDEALPDNPHPNYLSEVQSAANEAMTFLREKAEAAHVDPAAVANRATVTAWVDNPDDMSNPLASGWRYDFIGRLIAEKFVV